jgi:hypothetical protein
MEILSVSSKPSLRLFEKADSAITVLLKTDVMPALSRLDTY